jgi:hypothetical protein
MSDELLKNFVFTVFKKRKKQIYVLSVCSFPPKDTVFEELLELMINFLVWSLTDWKTNLLWDWHRYPPCKNQQAFNEVVFWS